MPVGGIAGAVLPAVAGGAANAIFGGHGSNQAQLPGDLQGMRAQQVQLLNYLTGFGGAPAYFDPMRQGGGAHFPAGGSLANIPPPPKGGGLIAMGRWANQYGSPRAYQEAMKRAQAQGGSGGGSQPGSPPAPASGQGPGYTRFSGPMVNAQATGGQGPATAGGQAPGLPKNPMQERMESYFGQLGIPTTALQQQATGGMQQFLASDPYGQARNALNQILGNPGEAYRTDFERSLAQANQSGGRFGSANALMRSQALNDYNSAALKNQLGAAQGIQGLGAQQMADLTGGYNMGSAQANQNASGQQQAIQLLLSQLQTAQGATMGAPTQQQPSGFGQFMQGFGGIAQLLPFLNPGAFQGGGGGGGYNAANINPYYQGPGFQR